MKTILNYTPHTINEVTTGTSFPSVGNARVSVEYTRYARVEGIQVYTTKYGEVTGLPGDSPHQLSPDTFYIVSMMVKDALPERNDLLSPGELVRNSEGQPIGCKGFVW